MDISIKLILQELVRRIWIIILCAVIGFGSAFVYTKYFTAPIYTTTMKVSALTNLQDDEAVSSIGTFINMMTLAERRVTTYIELMKTTAFYEQVAQASGTGYTGGAVSSMLEFEQVEDMGLFYVKITGTDPQAIKLIGDAVGQEMYYYISQYQTRISLQVVEPPVVPSAPINQTMQTNCVMGTLLGAVLAIAVIAVFAFFDTHIKDEETLSQRYNIPVLGSIPDFTVITETKSK